MTRTAQNRAWSAWRVLFGLAGDGPGGTVVRLLLPAAVVAPAALDLAFFALRWAGLLDLDSAAVVDTVTTTAVAILVIVYSARMVDRVDGDRRRKEAELRLSETRYREMFDEAPTGYHELDVQGRITRVNSTELSMLGYAAEEMVGRHVWHFLDDQDASRTAVLAKLSGTSPPTVHIELSYVRKDGTRVPLLLQDRILRDHEGRITGIRTTLQDITALKQVEAEHEGLIAKLQETLAELKTLKGFIPICASCKKVRDDQGFWDQVESYIMRHSEASFSHGICPDCASTLYPELQLQGEAGYAGLAGRRPVVLPRSRA